MSVSPSKSRAFRHHLSYILLQLKLAESAYKDYCSNGRILFYAKLLRLINSRLITEINDALPFFKQDAICEVAKLIYHLEAWTLDWDDHFNSLSECNQSNLGSEFIFYSRVRFPKEAVKIFQILFDSILKVEDSE